MIPNNIGIFLLTIMFFLSGFDKIINFKNVSIGLKSKLTNKLLLNLPLYFSYLSMILVIILEILGPILINYSYYTKKYYKYAKYSCWLLIVFVIMATYLYHFPPYGSQYYPFMSNLALIGGLIILSNYFDYLN